MFSLPANISDDSPIPFDCDTSYDKYTELAKYVFQAAYLTSNAFIHISIIRVVLFSGKSVYQSNSFFLIVATDSVVGAVICVSEVFIGRAFKYITPLCPILGPHFFEPSFFLKCYFVFTHYSEGFKTLTHVFLSFNRMSCVVFPVDHDRFWKKTIYVNIFILFLLPIGMIWNVAISRVYANPFSGGFSPNYIKKIAWASASILHLIYFIFSIFFISFFSGLTFYSLIVMKTRMKSAEKSITIATLYTSLQFVLMASLHVYFAFLPSPTAFLRPYLLKALEFSYDSLNFFSPIILILFSKQLQADLGLRKGSDSSVRTSRFPSDSMPPNMSRSLAQVSQ